MGEETLRRRRDGLIPTSVWKLCARRDDVPAAAANINAGRKPAASITKSLTVLAKVDMHADIGRAYHRSARRSKSGELRRSLRAARAAIGLFGVAVYIEDDETGLLAVHSGQRIGSLAHHSSTATSSLELAVRHLIRGLLSAQGKMLKPALARTSAVSRLRLIEPSDRSRPLSKRAGDR